jgi:FtsZ-interacting cell division protein ZipA
MFESLISKIGAAIVGLFVLVGLWLRGTWHKRRAEEAEARAEVAEKNLEAKQEEQKRHEVVDQASNDELVDYWRNKPK